MDIGLRLLIVPALVLANGFFVAAEFALVAEHGGSWSEEQAHALVGNPLPTSAEYLRRYGGVDLPNRCGGTANWCTSARRSCEPPS